MRRSVRSCNVFLAAALLSLALLPAAASAAASIPDDAQYVPGEVVVSFRDSRPGVSSAVQANALAAAVGGKVVRVSSRAGAALIAAGPGGDVKTLVSRLSADRRVRFVEPNYIYRLPDSVASTAQAQAPAAYLVRKVQGVEKKVLVPKAALRAMRSRTAAGRVAATYPSDKSLWDNAGWDFVGASMVWNNFTASKNVCVIDTGVDYLHRDLVTRVLKGWDAVNEDADPMDDHGHGTHVAGIIAARQNNAEGIAGVSPTARVVAVKALNAQGLGTSFDIAQAIRYCANRTDVSIINMSFGGPYSRLQEEAVTLATSDHRVTPTSALIKGKLVVAAAGNDASDMPTCSDGTNPAFPETSSANRLTAGVRTYPAGFATPSLCYDYDIGLGTCVPSATCAVERLGDDPEKLHAGNPAVLSVGAGGDDFVDYDCQASYTNFGSWVNVTAPGTDIYSTTPWDRPFTLNVYPDAEGATYSTRYDFMSGTSMAAPFVSGVAARAWGYKSALSNAEVAAHVLDTGTPVVADGVCWNESMGDLVGEQVTPTCAGWALDVPLGAWSCAADTTITRTASPDELVIENGTVELGAEYLVQWSATITAGSFTVSLGGVAGTPQTATGDYEEYITAGPTGVVLITADAASVGTIPTTVSVTRVYHLQPVAAVNVAAALDRGALMAEAIDAVTSLPLIGALVQAYQPLTPGVGGDPTVNPAVLKASSYITAASYTSPFDSQVYTTYPMAVDLINLPVWELTSNKVFKAGYTLVPAAAFVGGEGFSNGTIEVMPGLRSYAGYAAVPPRSTRFTAVSAWDVWDPIRAVPELTTWLPEVNSKLSPDPLFDGQISDFAVNYESCGQHESDAAGELSVFPNAQMMYADRVQVVKGDEPAQPHAVHTHQIATRVGTVVNPALPQYTGSYTFLVYNPDADFGDRQGSLFIWKDGLLKKRVDLENSGDIGACTTPWWKAATIFSGKTGAVTYTVVDQCVDDVDLPVLDCPL